MGWPSKLTDRELKRDSLLMSCTSRYPVNSNCTGVYGVGGGPTQFISTFTHKFPKLSLIPLELN